jgi:hypothetical protein
VPRSGARRVRSTRQPEPQGALRPCHVDDHVRYVRVALSDRAPGKAVDMHWSGIRVLVRQRAQVSRAEITGLQLSERALHDVFGIKAARRFRYLSDYSRRVVIDGVEVHRALAGAGGQIAAFARRRCTGCAPDPEAEWRGRTIAQRHGRPGVLKTTCSALLEALTDIATSSTTPAIKVTCFVTADQVSKVCLWEDFLAFGPYERRRFKKLTAQQTPLRGRG